MVMQQFPQAGQAVGQKRVPEDIGNVGDRLGLQRPRGWMVLKRAGRLPWEMLLRHPHWLTYVLGLLREYASSMPAECLCGHSHWLWSGERMLRRLLLTAHEMLGGGLLAHCHWLSHVLVRLPRHWLLLLAASEMLGGVLLAHYWLPHILVRLPRHWLLLLTANEMLGGWLSHIAVPRHWLLLVVANGMMEGALLAHCH
jgi:hypothetical protein